MTFETINAEITHDFAASPDQVFDAWLKPALIERWLFKSDTNHLQAQVDPREGGAFRITEQEGDEIIEHYGKFAVIDRPSRLAFSLEVPKHYTGVARLNIELAQIESGTRLTLILRGAGPEDAQHIWSGMFQRLEGVLAGNPA